MSRISWDGYDAGVFRSRRSRLGRALGDLVALIPAGMPRPRNYPANVHPFRAESHYLYLFGVPIAGAMGVVDGERAVLFVPPPEADAALWYGAIPSGGEIAERAQVEVRPMDQLGQSISGRAVACVAVHDPVTDEAVRAAIGRRVDRDRLSPEDERLADAMVALRLIHDEAAIASIRRAAEATTMAHRAGRLATRPGRTEVEVRAAMETEIVARGMTVAYPSIVTVHGEVLHNEARLEVIGDDDLLLADVGAESADGWASDVTRTWPASGVLSKTQHAIYEVVLDAQRTAIAMVRPGVRYRDIHLAASRRIAEGLVALGLLRGDVGEIVADGVHALFFPHGVGHLLGLDVHDMEDLGDRAGYAPGRTRSEQFGLRYLRLDRDLAPGMAVTIEPGIYFVPAILDSPELAAVAGDRLVRSELARFADVRGIRIEDDVLCTTGEPEVITAAIPK
ncbi:MAG: aminopeptidase P family protein [Deltaproteobacteria bacterium]|nr:aminopeptidase P family protein [Deltaproteobacteria bacterium]